MGELVVVEYLSLDGMMQSPGRPDEDPRGGFELGGWSGPFFEADPEAAQASMSGQGTTTAMLFGRRTYDDLVGHWLGTDEPNPFTDIIRETPKFVASRNADAVLPHPNSALLADPLPDAVRRLKETQEGDIVVLGSGDLVRQLAAEGLVDQYVLTIVPVVLGTGTRLFGDTHQALEVASSFTSRTGIVVATYRVVR